MKVSCMFTGEDLNMKLRRVFMLWAGWKYIMFPSWLQVSSKALDRILVFTAPCSTPAGAHKLFGAIGTACSQKLKTSCQEDSRKVSGQHIKEENWAPD